MKHMKTFNEGLDNKPVISQITTTNTYFFEQNSEGVERIECYNEPVASQITEWKIIGKGNEELCSYEGDINEDNIEELVAQGELDEQYIDYIETCLSNNPIIDIY